MALDPTRGRNSGRNGVEKLRHTEVYEQNLQHRHDEQHGDRGANERPRLACEVRCPDGNEQADECAHAAFSEQWKHAHKEQPSVHLIHFISPHGWLIVTEEERVGLQYG